MSRLAASFPSLAGKPGVEPWEPQLLDKWASAPKTGFPERYSARFVLNLWNPDRDWNCGAFDLHIAMIAWDTAHRFSFAVWVMDPWLP